MSQKKFILKTDRDYRSSQVDFKFVDLISRHVSHISPYLRISLNSSFTRYSFQSSKRHHRRSIILQRILSPANWIPRELNVPVQPPPHTPNNSVITHKIITILHNKIKRRLQCGPTTTTSSTMISPGPRDTCMMTSQRRDVPFNLRCPLITGYANSDDFVRSHSDYGTVGDRRCATPRTSSPVNSRCLT